MRIACLYLPSFPLQAHVRQTPHLVGAPVVVADSGLQGSTVVACSRAAWEEGIRPGMPTATARAILPEVSVLAAEPALYEDALAAVIDSALGLCEAVEPGSEAAGTHRVLYLRVPSRMRGDAFGQRLLAQLARQGFRGRVGVADDRFTAWVAAVTVMRPGGLSRLDDDARSPLFQQSCTTVPRGGSAAFLAPLPLSLLPIDAEVQGMLQTCGVKTLGDFAALPPPSVSRGASDVDFRGLARGQGPAVVRGPSRAAILSRRVVEHAALPVMDEGAESPGDAPAGETGPEAGEDAGDEVACACATCETPGAEAWNGALRTLCDRVAHRLDGRERVAARLVARLRGPGGAFAAFDVVPERPTASSRALLEALLAQLQAMDPRWTGIELAVTEERALEVRELALFGVAPAREVAPVAVAAAAHADEPEMLVSPRFAGVTPRLAHRSPSPSRARTRRRAAMQQQLF